MNEHRFTSRVGAFVVSVRTWVVRGRTIALTTWRRLTPRRRDDTDPVESADRRRPAEKASGYG